MNSTKRTRKKHAISPPIRPPPFFPYLLLLQSSSLSNLFLPISVVGGSALPPPTPHRDCTLSFKRVNKRSFVGGLALLFIFLSFLHCLRYYRSSVSKRKRERVILLRKGSKGEVRFGSTDFFHRSRKWKSNDPREMKRSTNRENYTRIYDILS